MSPAWFRVKRKGYGVGFPITWQGWATVFCFVAASAASGWLFPTWGALVIIVILVPALLLVAYMRSDDEWRWRNEG